MDAGLIFRAFDLNLDIADVIANVLGYIPIGAVLAEKGWMGLASAAGISFLAETSQLFAKGRSPSVIDLATNIIGAAIGIAICARWKPTGTHVTVSAGVAAVALALAVLTSLALITGMTPNHLQNLIRLTLVARPWQPSNDRGASAPGTLEARWTFDDVRGDTVLDESGQGLRGRLVNRPPLVAGIEGQALSLNGRNQWLNVGSPRALRLTGSMTITAWINAATFADDDAAIVSNYNGLGYQLDTSEDEGRHTVGFKLANTFGTVMARFGRTPLEPHRWYHVAGVYDSASRSVDVYLDGRLDNGCESGTVTPRQNLSGTNTYVGRSGQRRAAFAGLVDDVRIYSRALTPREIGEQIEQVTREARASLYEPTPDGESAPGYDASRPCAPKRTIGAQVAGLVVALGILVTVLCAWLWRWRGFRGTGLAISLAAGVVLIVPMTDFVPTPFRWCLPLLTLAGGASVVVSTREGQR